MEYVLSQYNRRLPGLGEEFLNEFGLTVERIMAFPDAWPKFTANTRSCRLRRFHYRVIYQSFADRILIHSIPHLHSDPEQWLREE